MKPFEDVNCKCHIIEQEINKKFPDRNWNFDDACSEWQKRSSELTNNNIEFEKYADENYACTCPTCGRLLCGWCV